MFFNDAERQFDYIIENRKFSFIGTYTKKSQEHMIRTFEDKHDPFIIQVKKVCNKGEVVLELLLFSKLFHDTERFKHPFSPKSLNDILDEIEDKNAYVENHFFVLLEYRKIVGSICYRELDTLITIINYFREREKGNKDGGINRMNDNVEDPCVRSNGVKEVPSIRTWAEFWAERNKENEKKRKKEKIAEQAILKTAKYTSRCKANEIALGCYKIRKNSKGLSLLISFDNLETMRVCDRHILRCWYHNSFGHSCCIDFPPEYMWLDNWEELEKIAVRKSTEKGTKNANK